MAWLDRLLGQAQWPSWEDDQLAVAVAASQLVLDGAVDMPRVEHQFELDWALALAARAIGRNADVDRAFVSANAISDNAAKQRALLWGAIVLGDARWSEGLADDYRHELAARDAGAIAALPGIWTLRIDVGSWHGYPRWFGSAAVAAGAIGERTLLEAVENKPIAEPWRQNREYRALALAWVRAGDIERAFAAAARMPGSERADAIVELLELAGDHPVDALAALAKRAMQATQSAPFVLGTDRAALRDFVAQASDAAVVAAIARRHLARGDLASARALIDTIPDNIFVRHGAALQVECARIQRDDEALDEIRLRHDENTLPILVHAAGDMRCMPVVHALLRDAKHGDRLAVAQIRRFIYQAHLDDAATLLRWAWGRMTPIDCSDTQAELVDAFAGAGRAVDALALFRSLPAHEDDIPERGALAAGYRLIVPLVVADHATSARELRTELAERRARLE